jgi:hypothetical protein
MVEHKSEAAIESHARSLDTISGEGCHGVGRIDRKMRAPGVAVPLDGLINGRFPGEDN